MTNSPVVPEGRSNSTVAVRFPFGKLAILFTALFVGIMVVYRLSEASGESSKTACLAAIAVSSFAALAGVLPLCRVWGKELTWVILNIFLSGLIRLLIGFLGVVIIMLFTEIDRTRFVFFLGLFYAVFLATDIRLALWALRHAEIRQNEDGKNVIHGTIWDFAVKH